MWSFAILLSRISPRLLVKSHPEYLRRSVAVRCDQETPQMPPRQGMRIYGIEESLRGRVEIRQPVTRVLEGEAQEALRGLYVPEQDTLAGENLGLY